MKKIFFTAIALIAFSGVSMAETVGAANLKSVTGISQAVKFEMPEADAILVSKLCEQAGARVFVQAVLADIPLEGAYNLAFAVKALCENSLL
ncbi:MAG: hypothetical protein M0D53_08625 [Flavobacterium sp. JAD_PAG50586_2]|nr:MAG: hypothetical protein M0D53_08625 [Flavobacterium sp. JAD_PAG50586_2]